MAQRKNKLSLVFTNDIIAAKLYRDSVELRIKGAWRDAGDWLVKCGELYTHIKLVLEAACFYTEAAECYMRVDKGEALSAYQKSVKMYCDIGRFDIGGKLEQRIAYINLYARHWEDAALHFRKAANFLSGDKLLDQSDHCIQKSAECLIQIGEYREASQLYQMVARSCVNSNLRRFNALDHLLMAMLCLLAIPDTPPPVPVKAPVMLTPPKPKSRAGSTAGSAAGGTTPGSEGSEYQQDFGTETGDDESVYQSKYEVLFATNERFEQIDYLWRRSKEKLFVRNVIKARMDMDLHCLADHLYYWTNIRLLSPSMTLLLRIPMAEIRKAIDDAAAAVEAARLADEAAAKKRAAKLRKRNNSSVGGSVAGSSFQSQLYLPKDLR